MLNLIMELFLHNLNCVQTINLCFRLNLRGGGPQLVGRFFIIHTFVMESPSLFSPLMKKKEK